MFHSVRQIMYWTLKTLFSYFWSKKLVKWLIITEEDIIGRLMILMILCGGLLPELSFRAFCFFLCRHIHPSLLYRLENGYVCMLKVITRNKYWGLDSGVVVHLNSRLIQVQAKKVQCEWSRRNELSDSCHMFVFQPVDMFIIKWECVGFVSLLPPEALSGTADIDTLEWA